MEDSLFKVFKIGTISIILSTFIVSGYIGLNMYSRSQFVFITQDIFTIEDKEVQIGTRFNPTKYTVRIKNENYGEAELDDNNLYDEHEIGNEVTLKVYKNKNNIYEFRY